MRASKGNKEYVIVESQQKSYQDSGFDILDDDGDIIAYGRGKTVPYGDYAALKEELEVLKATGESTEDQTDVINLLKTLAYEKGIDLGKAATVPGIIKKIKEFNPEGGA